MRFQGEVQDTYTQYLPVFMYNRYIGLFFFTESFKNLENTNGQENSGPR